MKKRLLLAITIATVFSVTFTLKAQVTIGSSETPNKGALLDLTEGSTTTKGLGLPRVKLNALTTSGTDLKVTVDGATGNAWDKNEHIGLLVYNTNKIETSVNRICPGIHVWNGNDWEPLVPYLPVGDKTRTFHNKRNDGFIHLDPESSDPMWTTLGKNPANYPLGPVDNNGNANTTGLPQLIDTRPGDTEQRYHITRFYVGYLQVDSSYQITQDYSCAQDGSKIDLSYEIVSSNVFEDGIWMSENLRAIVMPNGTDELILNSSESTTSSYYWYPNSNAANRATHGVLYNFSAATNKEKNTFVSSEAGLQEGKRIQGICPSGWHLPSDREWTDLENGIILRTSKFSTTADIGGTLLPYDLYSRPGATVHAVPMRSATVTGTSKSAADGGFDLMLAGASPLNLTRIDHTGWLWSSSPEDTGRAHWRFMYASQDNVASYFNRKGTLVSVRCKKD